jgi:hypothetical protein
MVVVLGGFPPRTAVTGTPSPSVPPERTQPPRSPRPSAHLAIGGGGDPVRVGPTPSPAPVRSARPPASSGVVDGLRVDFPQDGETVVSPRINAFGQAPGGARVLRQRPDGTVDVGVARPDGHWLLRVDLQPGENELRFRLERGQGEPVVVHVTLQTR